MHGPSHDGRQSRFETSSGSSVNSATSWRTHPWVVLILLVCVNILLMLDKAIPQIVAESVKQEFSLSDSQVGLMLGFAFSVPLGLAGIVLGPLIDRVSRKRYLAVLVTIWSSLTLLTGLAPNYLTLLFARAGLGAAEGTGPPAAMSVLGDVFPPHRRSTAIGIFKVGVPAGLMLASLVVAFVAPTYGWRAAFFVAGVPGLLTALAIMMIMREPRRGAMDVGIAASEPVPYLAAIAFVLRKSKTALLAAAIMLCVLSGSAVSAFAAPFLQRIHGISLENVGYVYALGAGLSIASPILAGLLADRLMIFGVRWTVLLLAGLAAAIGGAGLLMVFAPDATSAIAAFLLWQFLAVAITTPCFAVLMSLAPPNVRGSVLSIVNVTNMAVGHGLGPLAVGFASDQIGGPESLRYALCLVVGLSNLTATLLFWGAARAVSRGQQAQAQS